MNLAIIIGRIVRDPDNRRNGDLAISKFTLAVDRKSKDKGADFISCVAFGKTAEFVERYLKHGVKIAVEGRIQTGSYTKQNGDKVYTTDVMVNEVEFAESKKATAENSFIPADDFDDDGCPFK